MTISSEDLKLVCNYIQKSDRRPSSKMNISYMEFLEEDNEDYIRELKRKNRNLAIDAIIHDKIEDFKTRDTIFDTEATLEGSILSIKPVIKNITVNRKSYLDLSDIYVDVLTKLDTLTSSPMSMASHYTTFDVNTQKNNSLTDMDNSLSISKKILTNMVLLSNMIASNGRRGPAKSVIVGYEAFKYISVSNLLYSTSCGVSKGKISGIDIIPSNLISPRKIILMRVDQKIETGINVIDYPNDMCYYLTETPNSWKKQINWFELV